VVTHVGRTAATDDGQRRRAADAPPIAMRDDRQRRQMRSVASTGTIGGRRAWTVSMISVLSTPLQVDRRDPEIGVPELALDDDQRHPPAPSRRRARDGATDEEALSRRVHATLPVQPTPPRGGCAVRHGAVSARAQHPTWPRAAWAPPGHRRRRAPLRAAGRPRPIAPPSQRRCPRAAPPRPPQCPGGAVLRQRAPGPWYSWARLAASSRSSAVSSTTVLSRTAPASAVAKLTAAPDTLSGKSTIA